MKLPWPAGPLLLVVAVAAPARAVSQVRAASGAERPFARVVQVTRESAYIEVGRQQGLAVGAILPLLRLGREVATCEVMSVADHQAACETTQARPGDLVKLAEPSPPSPPKLPGPRNSPEVLARLREAILLAEIPKVEFAGPRGPAPARPAGVEASASAAAWATTGGGSTFVERIDATGRGAVWPGAEASLRLAGERWSDSANRQFRPGRRWQLYVWEARVTREGPLGDVTIGRFLPGGAPSQAVIDGFQARSRLTPNTSVGIYAGAVPDAVTTGPGLQRPAAGVQFSSGRAWGSDLEVSGQGRAGVVSAPGRPASLEAELAGQFGTPRADMTASVRAAGGGGSAAARLEAVRLDASARPWEGLVLSGGFVAFTGSPDGMPGLGPVAAATRRGDVEARWTLTPWLSLGGEASGERDVTSGLERATFGPMIEVAHLMGNRAGASAEWLEERGWWPGRTIDFSWWLRPSRALRVSGSLALSRWARVADAQDLELWASASITAALLSWLDLRASLSGNGAAFAAPAATYRAAGGGLAGSIALDARL